LRVRGWPPTRTLTQYKYGAAGWVYRAPYSADTGRPEYGAAGIIRGPYILRGLLDMLLHPGFPSHRVSGASHPAPAATTPKIARCLHSYPHRSPATPLLRLPSACSFSLAQRQRWPSDWNSGQTIGGVRCGEDPCLCPAALSLFCSPTTSKILLRLVSVLMNSIEALGLLICARTSTGLKFRTS
jgi:hypothetical protein